MRILFLNHNLREQGTYFRAFHVARELVRLGHQATLWTAAPHHYYRFEQSIADGVRIVETPSWNPFVSRDDGWGPIDIPWRMGRIVSEPCDLVYAFAHPPSVYLPARLAQVFRRKPMIVDWCDVYRDGIYPLRKEIRSYRGEKGPRTMLQRVAERLDAPLERRILREAQGVTVISHELARAALAEGVRHDNLLHYLTGANLEEIRPLDKAECRRKLGLPLDAPLLGYIANYNPDERFLLAALGRVFQRHPKARLVSTAPPFDPGLVEKEGVGSHLILLGRQPYERLQLVLGASDILVLPLEDNASNRGRWPNKFGDYLAAGRPVATNAVGDVADFFPSESNIPSGDMIGAASAPDPAAFADAIAGLLDQPQRWTAMGEAARRIAESRLNWSTIAHNLERFLSKYAAE